MESLQNTGKSKTYRPLQSVIAGLALILSGCGNDNVVRPSHSIPQDTFSTMQNEVDNDDGYRDEDSLLRKQYEEELNTKAKPKENKSKREKKAKKIGKYIGEIGENIKSAMGKRDTISY